MDKKDKKIQMLENMICKLQGENSCLKEQVSELQTTVNDNQKIIDSANKCQDEYRKCIAELNDARDKYYDEFNKMRELRQRANKDFRQLVKAMK